MENYKENGDNGTQAKSTNNNDTSSVSPVDCNGDGSSNNSEFMEDYVQFLLQGDKTNALGKYSCCTRCLIRSWNVVKLSLSAVLIMLIRFCMFIYVCVCACISIVFPSLNVLEFLTYIDRISKYLLCYLISPAHYNFLRTWKGNVHSYFYPCKI